MRELHGTNHRHGSCSGDAQLSVAIEARHHSAPSKERNVFCRSKERNVFYRSKETAAMLSCFGDVLGRPGKASRGGCPPGPRLSAIAGSGGVPPPASKTVLRSGWCCCAEGGTPSPEQFRIPQHARSYPPTRQVRNTQHRDRNSKFAVFELFTNAVVL